MNFRFLLIVSCCSGLLVSCVSPQQLEQLSAAQFAQMREEVPVSEDAADRAYVECIAKAIVAELPPPYASYDWDVELFDEEAVNAFAMPGGKIGVYTGLFKTATNENELATVIGHEVAHVTLNHSLDRANREMAKQGGLAIGELFGVPSGFIDAAALGADLGLLRPYGRGQESEADLIGLRYMASAGFDPRASVPLWQNMSKEGGESPPEFFSTHPSNESRINDLSAAMPEASRIYDRARATGKRLGCRS